MSKERELSPDEIVEEMRAMDKQIIDGKKPTIFKQTADLIEDLRKKPGTVEEGKFISNK